MAVPKKKRTKGSGGKRRSHDSLKSVTLSKCPQCGHPVKPHQVCPNCGSYKGTEKIRIKSKAEKTS
jgi:large subunit ribosomal protein L32